MSCCVISTYFLYLISFTDVHFVGQGDGRPHLGGQISQKRQKEPSFWTSVNVCEQNEAE